MRRRTSDAGRRSNNRETRTLSLTFSRKRFLALLLPGFLGLAGILAAAINPALLGLAGELYSPEAGSTIDSIIEARVTAEGHPTSIVVTATPPAKPGRIVAECEDTTVCSGSVLLDQCGIWKIDAVVEYAHEDPNALGFPYLLAETIPVLVVGCDVFADGFESGDLSKWSSSNGG